MLPMMLGRLRRGRREAQSLIRQYKGTSNRTIQNEIQSFHRVIDGPLQSFEKGRMANQTFASAIGTAGSTVVLTTVATEGSSSAYSSNSNNISNAFLTNEYRERHHAVGRFPKARHRRDFRMLSLGEVLASRVIDRSLRPVLKQKLIMQTQSANTMNNAEYIQRYHVLSSLQSMNRYFADGDGDPIPLAINTAAAALDLQVAAVSLGVTVDGTVIQDAPPTRQEDNWLGHLIYAGTRGGKCVMMEWGALPSPNDTLSHQIGLRDEMWTDLLEIARNAVDSRLDSIENYQAQHQGMDPSYADDALIRESLGLTESTPSVQQNFSSFSTPANGKSDIVSQRKYREELINKCEAFCRDHLRLPLLRIFGWTGEEMTSVDEKIPSVAVAFPMDGNTSDILKKSIRGRRETIMQQEVANLLDNFIEKEGFGGIEITEEDRNEISNQVYHKLMREALWEASTSYGCRSDGRKPLAETSKESASGRNTVRPIKVTVPALPDAVHGSAQFSRGETGVLCTVTLAAPKEGLPDQDPFDSIRRERLASQSQGNEESINSNEFYSLPVGSLRFLRTQEALVSDLNSRKSKAEKERTGASGSLAEVRRAFLQYDFPDYCTGQVPSGSGQIRNRRAMGHGALAEKAIFPVLPSPESFPYAIRITAETVDSNGSSSMASICGSLMALLDAGVPVLAPVAGISVGLATKEGEVPSEQSLLLDITGTEDHYGAMDFKVGGTRDAVTALQLDVKEPVDTNILVSALKLARCGRNVVLNEMEKQAKNGFQPRPKPKLSAPAVEVVKYDASRKRDLIGPGGVVLRQLEDRYGVEIDLTQEGRCLLYGEDRDLVSKARSTVMDLVADVMEGEVYEGTIVELKDFGAIVELLRNKEGILHVSELTDEQEARAHPEGIAGFVRDFLKVGQTVDVLCIGVDPMQGSIKLSRKALLRRQRSRS